MRGVEGMNEYRGKHAPSQPWAIASSAYMPVRRGRHRKKARFHRLRVFLLCFLVLLILSYPFLESRIIFADFFGQFVDRHTIKSTQLPEKANNLKIVYVSDIHWGFWFSDNDLRTLIKKINNLNPSIVIFGGDYATDQSSAISFFRKLKDMPKILTQYGVFGVLGDSDRGETLYEQTQLYDLTSAMHAAEIKPLVNQVEPIPIGERSANTYIYLAGADDSLNGSPDLNAIAGKVRSDDFVVFIAHNPSIINDAQRTPCNNGSLRWIDVGLFGHTHGGQMTLFSDLLHIAEDVQDNRRKSGWFTENQAELLISRGVGTSVVPFRLFCFPQIHCIDITCK